MAANPLALLLTHDAGERSHYWTVTAQVVTLDDGKIRNITDNAYGPLAGYGDLYVTAQGDVTPRDAVADGAPLTYGWHVKYRHVYSAGPSDIANMSRVLGRIVRKMAADDSAYGYPLTFGQYLTRAAAAIGARTFAVRIGNAGGSYDDNTYRWMDAAGAIAWMADIEASHR